MIAPLLWVGSTPSLEAGPTGFLIATPVLLHRVIVFIPPDIDDSDPFARAIVNLGAAGISNVAEMARLLGIRDERFLNTVIRRLAEASGSPLDRLIHGPSSDKREADKSTPAVAQRLVCYMVQDCLTGFMWPRLGREIRTPEFDEQHRQVRLGSVGRPLSRPCMAVPRPHDDVPDTPQNVKALAHTHVRHMRTTTVHKKSGGVPHLAVIGRPESKPIFGTELVQGSERRSLLMTLDAVPGGIAAHDPFEIGNFHELTAWQSKLREHSPEIYERANAWATRRAARSAGKDAGEHGPVDRASAHGSAHAESPAATSVDLGSVLIRLAERLADEIADRSLMSFGLSYGDAHDREMLRSRLAALGFTVPPDLPNIVPGQLERARRGEAIELLDLFYAWALVVDELRGHSLAAEVPDLPGQLVRHARGQLREAPRSLAAATRTISLRTSNERT